MKFKEWLLFHLQCPKSGLWFSFHQCWLYKYQTQHLYQMTYHVHTCVWNIQWTSDLHNVHFSSNCIAEYEYTWESAHMYIKCFLDRVSFRKYHKEGAKQALQNFWWGSNNHNKHYSISKGGQELSKGRQMPPPPKWNPAWVHSCTLVSPWVSVSTHFPLGNWPIVKSCTGWYFLSDNCKRIVDLSTPVSTRDETGSSK